MAAQRGDEESSKQLEALAKPAPKNTLLRLARLAGQGNGTSEIKATQAPLRHTHPLPDVTFGAHLVKSDSFSISN